MTMCERTVIDEGVVTSVGGLELIHAHPVERF